MVSGYWLGLTLGRLLPGNVVQKIGEKHMLPMCLLAVIIGLLIVWLVPIATLSDVGLFLTGFSLEPIYPTMIAVMSKIVSSAS
jgi:fucose permease